MFRPDDHSTRLKGKHFAVSQHPPRKSCVICAYQKDQMESTNKPILQIIVQSVKFLVAKIALRSTILAVAFRDFFILSYY